jgi:dihydroneopterin aldolase
VDRILLEGMLFKGRHGARRQEKTEAQEFKVDVEVDADLHRPGRTDRLEDTIDYTRVHAIAKDVIEGESVNLIETLADRIADRVLNLPRVGGVSVRVTKWPASMRPFDGAAVHIRRTRA